MKQSHLISLPLEKRQQEKADPYIAENLPFSKSFFHFSSLKWEIDVFFQASYKLPFLGLFVYA